MLVVFFEGAELGGGAVHEPEEARSVIALAICEGDTLVEHADGVHVWFPELVKEISRCSRMEEPFRS